MLRPIYFYRTQIAREAVLPKIRTFTQSQVLLKDKHDKKARREHIQQQPTTKSNKRSAKFMDESNQTSTSSQHTKSK
jgi:hypothetical protein